jgi:hypothetical protein
LESRRHAAGGRHRQPPPPVELGNEPPLGLDGDVEEPIDRRRVSIRWLAATVLVALAGGSLMGGAVWAALDGEYRFAQLPEFARQTLRAAGERITTRKADRMSLLADASTARQTLRVSTTTRVQDREIVRVRPFIRVATPLATSPSEFASSVPAFNPVKMMAEDDTRPEEGQLAEPTGELSIVMRDLGQVAPTTRIVASLRNEDVLYSVRQALASNEPELRSTLTSGFGAGLTSTALAYAAGQPDPRKADEPAAVAENMSSVPKTATETTGGNSWGERTVIAKKGENLNAVLRELGSVPQATTALISSFGSRAGLADGHRVRVLFDRPSGHGRTR